MKAQLLGLAFVKEETVESSCIPNKSMTSTNNSSHNLHSSKLIAPSWFVSTSAKNWLSFELGITRPAVIKADRNSFLSIWPF